MKNDVVDAMHWYKLSQLEFHFFWKQETDETASLISNSQHKDEDEDLENLSYEEILATVILNKVRFLKSLKGIITERFF